MTMLSPGMDAGLAADDALIFCAAEIILPGYTIRLLDGSGELLIQGFKFAGDDPVFGVLSSVTDLTDGVGDEVPAISITLLPPSDTAAGILGSAAMQGARVTLLLGVIDKISGLVVPDPYFAFIGEVDVPVIKSGAAGRTVEYEVVSVTERLFSDDEGMCLSDGFHQSVYPGETGLAAVSSVELSVYWGIDPPPASVVAGRGSYIGIDYGQFN